MKREGGLKKYMSVVIATIAVLTVFSVIFAGSAQINKPLEKTNSSSVKNIAEQSTENLNFPQKISPVLENKIKNAPKDEKIWVYVATRDVKELGDSLRSLGIDTPIGTYTPQTKLKASVRILLLQLTPAEILKVSKLSSTVAVFNHPDLKTQVLPQEREELIDGKIGNVLNPKNFQIRGIYQTLHHHAREAWAMGFDGSNTTIAIVDTGVDFAQPNLYGAWAVDENPSSPYYGWPIAYDSWSMILYLEYNITGMDAYYKFGVPSWYVNTSYNTTMLANGTVYFNGHYYNVSGIPSASGHYHLGLLPETYNYLYYFGEVPAVLLTDSTTPYKYDTVYVDLNLNYNFTDEKPTNKSSPVAYRDDYNATSGTTSNMWNGGDGYPDWSGGMIYYIANGSSSIPGSDLVTWWYGIPNRIPGNGNLVAFVGDFDEYPHGTACAANAVSRGVTIGGLGVGMAPRAKIIAEPHFWFDAITEWMFSELGYNMWFYDGDDAQISSNSWGSSFIHWDGWDTYEDRYLNYIAEEFPYFDNGVIPITSFLVALGNGGPGYGTATSPAVQAAISVGAGSEWGYRQILFGDSKLYDSYYGDVVDFSARGPFANGKSTPDILATGEFGITPMALNYPDIYGNVGDGSRHFDLFSGTSMATPVAAGGLALVYDAYYKTYGSYPDMWTAKNILLSSADDHNYDPLSQGPGWLNASRAVEIASGKMGITVYPNIWNVGNYTGNEYEMFAGIAYPGDSMKKEFTLTNHNSTVAANVRVSSAIYQKSYEYDIDTPALSGTDVSYWVNLSSLSPSIPINTDLLQIIAYTNYTNLDDISDSMHNNPKIRYVLGYLWDYINYTTVSNYTDRMRMAVSGCQGNTIDVMFHDPMKRLHGDMWYQLRVLKYQDVNMTFHIKIVGYRAVNWAWLSFDATNVNVPAGGQATFNATISIPANTKPGIYEGKILVDDGTHINAIPVVVYVAAQINSESDVITIGGYALNENNTYLYDNSHVRGLYDWLWRAEAGDWRFFFLNVSSGVNITNAYLTVDITWESNMTDIDAFILENRTDVFSYFYPSIFGPYTLTVTGQSKDMYIKGGMYQWQTSSGGAREVIAAPLQNGLVEIMLHNVLYSGLNASEKFTVKVYITTYQPNSMDITVGKVTGLSGKREVDFKMGISSTSLDIKIKPLIYLDERDNIPISTGESRYYVFQTSGWTYLGAQTYCTDDIDLYLYYSDDGSHFYLYSYSATSSGNEFVETDNPSQHAYWLVLVYGYDVTPGNTYDIIFYEGLPGLPMLGVSDVPPNVVAGTEYSFNITYDFNGYNMPAGNYTTSVYFGPNGSGGVYPINIHIRALDQEAPSIIPLTTGVVNTTQPTLVAQWNDQGIYSPPKNATWWIDGVKIPDIRTGISGNYLYARVPFLLAEGIHEVKVYYEDTAGNGNSTSWTITVDTTPPSLTITSPPNGIVPLTYNSTLWINGTTDPGANVTINGVDVPVNSDGSFSYQATLVEGLNIFVVTAKDSEGNSVSKSVSALYLPQLPELWDNISKLQSEIDYVNATLQNEINNLQNEIDNLNATLQNEIDQLNTTLQNKIDQLNATLQNEINNLQNEIDNLQNEINDVRNEIAKVNNTLHNEIADLNNALKENVTALNSAISQAKVDLINRIKSNITMINREINENVTAINGEITNIKSDINKINDDINGINKDISRINNDIGNINDKNKKQDNGISLNEILAIIGIVLALIAMGLAFAFRGKKEEKKAETTPEEKEKPEEEEKGEFDIEEV